ncbi:tandem-95 repeat protein [Mycolicibacterium arabiense]|nr:Ig-like domain-containing protein [Mycolicibacterium arabiense]MCV7373878.1 tandem-95 repeat protein [Mycolicibacterium arabiense]
MGFSHHVGRVGALAVALGIGTAVAFPATALADDGAASASSDGPAARPSSPDAPGAPTGDDAQSAGEGTTTGPTSTTTSRTPSDDPSAAPGRGEGTSTPAPGTVSAQTNTGTNRADDDGSTNEGPGPGAGEPPAVEDIVIEESPATSGSPTPVSPQETAPTTPAPLADSPTSLDDASSTGSEVAAAAPTAIRPAPAPVTQTAQTVRVDTAQPTPRADVTATPRVTVAPVSAASTVTTTAFAPAPSLGPIGTLLAAPAAFVGTVLNAVLTPFLGGAPAAPAQPTLLWAVLAFVRREIQRTFFNSTPIATNQSVTLTLPSTGSVSVPIPLSGTDADGDRLTYTVPARGTLGGPAHGTVTVDQATGTFRYDPDDAFALTGGTDTFTYTVSDAAARRTLFGIPLSFSPTSSTATVTLAVNGVGQAPVTRPDTLTVAEETPGIVDVLANDDDPNGDALTLTGVTTPSHGVATFGPGGLVTYAPARDFAGIETLTYTVSDGTGRTTSGTLTITVTGVNDPPLATDDTTTVAENGTVVIDVLANDTDVDDTLDPSSVTVVAGPAHGTVTVDRVTGRITYVNDGDEATPDTFTYTVADRAGATSNTATVTVGIAGVNDAPVAGGAQTVTVREGTATTITLTGTDADGDTLTFTIITPPGHGTLGPVVRVDATTATVVYTPDANYTGADTFTYTVGDGTTTAIAPATVSLRGVAVPPPVASTDSAIVAQGTPTTIDVLANDSHAGGVTLAVTGVSQPTNGTATFTASGVTYAPRAGFYGTDTFTYTVSNGTTTSVGTVTVTVDAAPVFLEVKDLSSTDWVIQPLYFDPEGKPVTATVTGGAHLEITPDRIGDLIFGYRVRVTDAAWASRHIGETVTVTLTVDDGVNAPLVQLIEVGAVGNVRGVGLNFSKQLVIPALPVGMQYTAVAGGDGYSVLLRSDGSVLVAGVRQTPFTIPPLPTGMTYTAVAAGYDTVVLLRSDGQVFATGDNEYGQLNIPPGTYTQISAGGGHVLALRADGTVVGAGTNLDGQLTIPAPPAGVVYTGVSAGDYHSVFLRSDGQAVSTDPLIKVPVLPDGVRYTQVASGADGTVFLRSDGQAVLSDLDGIDMMPALPDGVVYTAVAAAQGHVVLLRSDGTAIGVGRNREGQLNIPVPANGNHYTAIGAGYFHTLLIEAPSTTV